MHEQHPGDGPDVRHVPVARQDDVDAAASEQREHVAGVQHLVPLAAGARNRHEMVVADEDPDVGRALEPFFDPAVVLTTDLALVEVRLRRVDGDERDVAAGELAPKPRVASAEGVLEVEIAHVARVVVPRDADDRRARERSELALRDRVLVGVPVVGEVACYDDEVRVRRVDLGDRGAKQLLAVAAAAHVDVRELGNEHFRSVVSPAVTYVPAPDRYERMAYRRSGRSGLLLPAVSLGFWHNFGGDRPLETSRAIVRRAFDLGITHFDLANNYGPPYGSAEETFGRLVAKDLRPFRDELVISTKAGYDMWPGLYGEWGSRQYLLASLDQSLGRMGLEYVDIFYSHRFDPETPLRGTMGALATAVHEGKALYVGISSYSAEKTREAAEILAELGTPLLIHQPSYSMLNRWIEPELLDALEELGVGCIGFSPLAQGMLTDKYLHGIPEGSRASRDGSLSPRLITETAMEKIRALNEIAQRRGQTLAQLALAWTLRDPRMTSTLVGASSVEQLESNVAAIEHLDFTDEELAEIDRYATDADINLWATSSA